VVRHSIPQKSQRTSTVLDGITYQEIPFYVPFFYSVFYTSLRWLHILAQFDVNAILMLCFCLTKYLVATGYYPVDRFLKTWSCD
jgi:hypothetical protein